MIINDTNTIEVKNAHGGHKETGAQFWAVMCRWAAASRAARLVSMPITEAVASKLRAAAC